MVMKKLINYIAQKVWNEVGVSLKEGITEHESLKATFKVVSEIAGEDIAEELLINLLEAKGDDKIDPDTEVTYKNKDGEKKTTTYKTAIASDKESPQYKAADDLRKKGGSEEKEDDEKFSKADQVDMMTQAEKDAMAAAEAEKQKPKGNGYVGDKDKSLKQGDPTTSEEYQRDLPPDDVDFEKRNKKFANPTPPEPYKMPDFMSDNPKFPKKYVKALERMMNTQPKGDATKWQHYSDIAGGAGQISAQAGELMTMMGATMSDEEWNEFSNSLLKHEASLKENHRDVFMKKDKKTGKYEDNPGSRVIDSSWVKAATQSRKAIKDRLLKQYGEGTTIVAGAWDTESDVEALGMSNYSENKGFSTDMYLKVRKPDGEEVLDEVSLKKSTYVNFLNSGAGKFNDWDPELPDDINANVYAQKARERNISYISRNKAKIEELLKTPKGKEINAVLKSKKLTLDQALEGNSRDKQKVLWTAINTLANAGDTSAKEIIARDNREHTEYQERAVKAITENPKMKEGMMEEIRNEFPLKAVSEGEETMAIGPFSLDKSTMKAIFGTDDYNKLKENLVAEPPKPIIDPKTKKPKLDKDGNPKMTSPTIGYKIQSSGEVFPVADIVIREDGRGYGGQFKFEMKLNQKGFADRLRQAQSEVYG